MRILSILLSSSLITCLFLCSVFLSGNQDSVNRAYADSQSMPREVSDVQAPVTPSIRNEIAPSSSLSVQAVLSAKSRAVISSTIDAQILKFNFSNGDIFKKGDVLIEYDCTIDRARLKEAESRQRTTSLQLGAYEKLHTMESVSEIEFAVAKENNEQAISLVDQIRGRLASCRIKAPFDGRVTNKMASQYEFAQTGRVLMDISSREPLRAEFLIPSKWLQWLNIGTPLQIRIGETGRTYKASIVAIHGEVDPVSQSVQIIAEMEAYHEELLPGMSGQATFAPETAEEGKDRGFIGLVLDGAGANGEN